MLVFLTFLHIILNIFFLKSYYILYFITLFIFAFFTFKIKEVNIILYLSVFFITIFMLGYFDETVFDLYLFFDLDRFYIYIGGSIAYILTILHSIIFFFIAFKKS